MTTWLPIVGLLLIVAAILLASHRQSWQRVFHWLPVPLWCYALPAIAVACGALPAGHPAYRLLTDQLLPLALGLLLLGVNLSAVIQVGGSALAAAAIGAVGIVVGAPLSVRLLTSHLPPEAWKGAGALAGTWTGGTMNLLALRSVLGTPETIFAPLIIVDAVIAYSWMALLVAASGFQRPINRWLRTDAMSGAPATAAITQGSSSTTRGGLLLGGLIALGLSLMARSAAAYLPTSPLVSSATAWMVLLVTTFALGLSLIPNVRRLGAHGSVLGYPCLYLVLAATGAQASLEGLRAAPAWLAVGVGVVAVHGTLLLLMGRLFRIPLGVLATASQANIGGVVSAPLVGAVYHQSLMPVGLVLAMVGNALGTYLGWGSATFCRWLLHV